MTVKWHARLRAAGLHAGVSASVGALIALLVFGVWFPGEFRRMSGGTELVTLVVSVDLVLGPLVTLAIFDLRKGWPVLRRDLAVICLLQLGGLAYGLHTVFIARPVALALEEDRFRVVAAVDVRTSELVDAPDGLRSLSLTGPRMVSAQVPTDPDKKFEAINLGLSGFDIGTRPSLWHPWDDAARAQARQHAKPLAPLLSRHPQQRAAVEAVVARLEQPLDALAYIPAITLRDDWVVLLDAGTGDILGFAPIDGF